jgi:GH25 family lysozyme M1 (1,4-beta-N-acetylmuramidase)
VLTQLRPSGKFGKPVALTALLVAVLCLTAGCNIQGDAKPTSNAANTPNSSTSIPTPDTNNVPTTDTTPTPTVSTPTPSANETPPPGTGGNTGNGSGNPQQMPVSYLQSQAQDHNASVPSGDATPSPTPAASPSPWPSPKPSATPKPSASPKPTHSSKPGPKPTPKPTPTPKPAPTKPGPKPLPGSGSGPLQGIDVSDNQGAINWSALHREGVKFAYIKATEGTYYTSPSFASQYDGAYHAGIVRGAYVFAIPSYSSGKAQADFLVAHGGGWSADGLTLPATLDIEYNPYGSNPCYGLSQGSMRTWLNSFLNEYHARTGRWATIYTTANWWSMCTGGWTGPTKNDPLWIAEYGVGSPSPLVSGYHGYTIWQYSSTGPWLGGDSDVFNGSWARLEAFAENT